MKFEQIVALNLAPDIISRASNLSKKPIILSQDSYSLEINNQDSQKTDAILVSIYESLNKNFLSNFPNLKYIGIFGTSSKKIDLNYCDENSIKISPVFEYCDHETAEWVIYQILKYYREQNPAHSIFEKTLGLVGAGAVGFKLAQKALAMGMNVNFYTREINLELVKLGAKYINNIKLLFKSSPIISFHTPAHMSWLTHELLDNLSPNTLLINTCLGKISHNDDLELFLAARPDINIILDSIALKSYPDLAARSIADSHAAYDTVDSRERLISKFLSNLESFF